MGGTRTHARLTSPSARARGRKLGFAGRAVTLAVAALCLATIGTPSAGAATEFRARFILSATENADQTIATLPLYRGTSGGQNVFYVVTDASDQDTARRLGVNFAPRLNLAKGTAAVMPVGTAGSFFRSDRFLPALTTIGTLQFPATVNFAPVRRLTPGPNGFPPAIAEPGAVAEAGYTPLVQLPNGVVLNAPHIINNTGRADKVRGTDMTARTVQYGETEGRHRGFVVHYLSFEASDPVAAAVEDVTFAPALGASPTSSRALLRAFTNGQLGAGNPNRQGLNSTVVEGLDPLNILGAAPALFLGIGDSATYSPLWGVRAETWLVPVEQRIRQSDFAAVAALEAQGRVAGGFPGFLVNCPLLSINLVF